MVIPVVGLLVGFLIAFMIYWLIRELAPASQLKEVGLKLVVVIFVIWVVLVLLGHGTVPSVHLS